MSDLQEKLDEYNELTLRNAALTFSTEGVSRDLKVFLARKAEFVSQTADAAARLAMAPSKSPARNKAVDELVAHVLEEIRGTDSTINYVLMRILDREEALAAEASEGLSKPKAPAKKKKRTRKKPRRKSDEKDGGK